MFLVDILEAASFMVRETKLKTYYLSKIQNQFLSIYIYASQFVSFD